MIIEQTDAEYVKVRTWLNEFRVNHSIKWIRVSTDFKKYELILDDPKLEILVQLLWK